MEATPWTSQDNPYMELQEVAGKVNITGSSVVCTPPVTNTDVDYIVVFHEGLCEKLTALGYTQTPDPDQEYPNSSVAACFRKGHANVIAVITERAFHQWEMATLLAAAMNLQEKRQRVLLFQFLTEGSCRAPYAHIDIGVFYPEKPVQHPFL